MGTGKKSSSHRGSGWEWVSMNEGGDSSEVSLEWYLGIIRWMEAKKMVEGRWQRNVPDRWSHICKGSIIEHQLERKRTSGDGSEGPGGSLWRTSWSDNLDHLPLWLINEKLAPLQKAWWEHLFMSSSPLGLCVHKILFVPSKTEVSVSLSPLEGH